MGQGPEYVSTGRAGENRSVGASAKTTINSQFVQLIEEGEKLLRNKLRITWTFVRAHAINRYTKKRTAFLVYMQKSTRR